MAAFAAPPPGAHASVYRNAKYGFEAPVASGLTACAPPAPQPAHGITLRPIGSDCADGDRGPEIRVNGEFNAVGAADTDALAASICALRAEPARFGPLAAKGCFIGQGRATFCVLAQRPNASDPTLTINYSVCTSGMPTKAENRRRAKRSASEMRLVDPAL